ncbi:DnaJ domain-containing protein [Halomonas organivorans]
MTSARFSTFELLLLQSRDQADTAALLLLAWVLTHRGTVGEAERAHLIALTGAFRHGHDLAPILEIAASQDLSAIQLAAEVLQKELHGEAARAFLRLAIALASDPGEPTLANHHVLRFLADLLGVAPEEFATLYASQAGRPLAPPADPSRRDYWQQREGRTQDQRHEGASGRRRADQDQDQDEATEAAQRRRAEQAEARRQAREAREEAKRQREAQRQEEKARRRAEREAARQHKQARREAEKRRRQAEREAARRDRQKAEERRRQRRRAERERQEHRQEEQRHRERHSRREDTQRDAGPPPPEARVHSALAVLGLEPGASRGEIRKAYRRLAQAHHPDRFYHEGEAIVASASRRFQRIRRAYDFLMKVS